LRQGFFISLEGGEGCGKTTQAKLLHNKLQEKGYNTVLTREPGGSEGAELIRNLLVTGDTNRWESITEVLLLFAARVEHIENTIKPALNKGKIVISDRFTDSTIAYQGYGHKLGKEKISKIQNITIGDFEPNLTIFLKLPVESGLKRANLRKDSDQRYEKMDHDFHKRLFEGFNNIAKDNPNRFKIIDASGSIEEIEKSIFHLVSDFIKSIS